MPRDASHSSWVWQFFTKQENSQADEQQKIAKCNICLKIYIYTSSIGNLKRHLDHKHPTSADDEISRSSKFEQDDDSTSYSNKISPNPSEPMQDDSSVFRETLTSVYIAESPPKSVLPSRPVLPHSPVRKRHKPAGAPSPWPFTSQPAPQPELDDSLERFGRYAASLLRRLPMELADRLQAEFIANVIREQVEHDRAVSSAQSPPS